MSTAAEETTETVEKLQDDLKAVTERAEKAEAELTKYTEGDTKGAKSSTRPAKDGDEIDDPQEARKDEGTQINKDELPADVRAFIEKQESDRAALEARLEKAEKEGQESGEIAKAERETRVSKEYLVKAEGFMALPIAKDELGPILRAADEGIALTKEQGESLTQLLKGTEEQIRQSEIWKAFGTDERGMSGGDAFAEIQRKAEDLRKADPKLTANQAMERVAKEDPALQQRYLDDVR